MKRFIAAALFSLTTVSSLAIAGPTYGTVHDRDLGDITVSTPVVATFANGISLASGVLTITGSSAADTASVAYGTTRSTIVARRGSASETFDTTLVTKIVFYGNAGADTFTNSTSIPSEAYGGDDNDTLNGGSGADYLVGGYGQDTIDGNAGNDTVWGSGGSDVLEGGSGDDLVKGHGGNDQISGGAGTDRLYGGTGEDTITGGSGRDTIVTIGGGTDSVAGGTDTDFFWIDTTDSLTDASATETAESYINKVAAFYSVSYNGGASSTPIAKDLTNYNLPDPIAEDADVELVDFGDRPLFSSLGPTKEDVIQGKAGDCFILGPLSAVADATPDSIRKLVVDLDDGTYAVRFFRTEGGAAEFVRVDGQLWVDETTKRLEYAKLGAVEEALWVPIVEKAFALYRRQNGLYTSIDGGNGSGSGTVILGADNETFYEIDDTTHGKQAIINWVNAGRPAGATANYINAQVPVLLNWIADRQDEGFPVYTGNIAGASNTTAFNEDYWRRGQHIIMIDHVNFDTNGNPISLTLRDQVGPQTRTISDFARIYFLIGRARLYEMP